jgi:hypothetical protein
MLISWIRNSRVSTRPRPKLESKEWINHVHRLKLKLALFGRMHVVADFYA